MVQQKKNKCLVTIILSLLNYARSQNLAKCITLRFRFQFRDQLQKCTTTRFAPRFVACVFRFANVPSDYALMFGFDN